MNGGRAGGVQAFLYNLFGGWERVLEHCAADVGMEHIEVEYIALPAGVVFAGARGRCFRQCGRRSVRLLGVLDYAATCRKRKGYDAGDAPYRERGGMP